MRDVWVYAQSKATVADVSVALAELGFAPHYIGTGETMDDLTPFSEESFVDGLFFEEHEGDLPN